MIGQVKNKRKREKMGNFLSGLCEIFRSIMLGKRSSLLIDKIYFIEVIKKGNVLRKPLNQ